MIYFDWIYVGSCKKILFKRQLCLIQYILSLIDRVCENVSEWVSVKGSNEASGVEQQLTMQSSGYKKNYTALDLLR